MDLWKNKMELSWFSSHETSKIKFYCVCFETACSKLTMAIVWSKMLCFAFRYLYRERDGCRTGVLWCSAHNFQIYIPQNERFISFILFFFFVTMGFEVHSFCKHILAHTTFLGQCNKISSFATDLALQGHNG